MASASELMAVEVVYATPSRQVLLKIRIAAAASVADVIEHSGILKQFPELDLGRCRVGIFSRLVSLETTVQGGDRVEIYRELIADPKIVRRQRVAKARKRALSG